MAQDGEENLHCIFESVQLHPSPSGKVFRDIRHRSDPALHATETGSPGRSPANPPDADAQGKRHPDPKINPEAKTNRTHSDTDRETRPSQLSRNPAGRLSWNQTAKETRHNRQQRTGTVQRRTEGEKDAELLLPFYPLRLLWQGTVFIVHPFPLSDCEIPAP